MKNAQFKFCQFMVSLLVVAVAPVAFAVEYRAAVGVGAEHTDNVDLSSDEDSRSDIETSALVRLGLTHDGVSLDADLDYRYEKLWYKESSGLDESSIVGDTDLSWEMLANRLFLDVTHSRRNTVRDSADLDISTNREDRDILNVSPYYLLRLSGTDSLRFGVGWTAVKYEDTESSDSERYNADLSWIHQLSKVDSFSVDIGSTDVESEEGGSSNYRYDYFTVGYQAALSRLSYTLRVGANRADREEGLDDVDGYLLDIEADYRSGFQTWSLLLRHALSDSSIGNDNEVLEDLDRRDEFNDEVDVLEESVLQLDWSSEGLCGRCVLRVGAFAEDNAYEIRIEDDNLELGALARFNYRLTRQGTLGLGVTYRDLDYDDDVARDDYDETQLRLSYDHRFGRGLRVGLFVAQRERQSDETGPDYDELRGGLNVNYSFLP